MSTLSLIMAVMAIGAVIGFLGLAVVSTFAGQIFLFGVAAAIASYWIVLSAQDRAI